LAFQILIVANRGSRFAGAVDSNDDAVSIFARFLLRCQNFGTVDRDVAAQLLCELRVIVLKAAGPFSESRWQCRS
jgi:hypothetical protein